MDVQAGESTWQKDPFKRDRKLDEMRGNISPGAKGMLDWLFRLAQDHVLYFIKELI